MTIDFGSIKQSASRAQAMTSFLRELQTCQHVKIRLPHRSAADISSDLGFGPEWDQPAGPATEIKQWLTEYIEKRIEDESMQIRLEMME